jgi:hypothetical protein
MSSRDTKPNWLARLSVAAITLLVSGCQDYAARRDTIAFHAGEAAAYNKAIHTIDPWPAAAARTDLDYDGERAVAVIERYKAGGAPASAPAGMTINVPMPAVAAPR